MLLGELICVHCSSETVNRVASLLPALCSASLWLHSSFGADDKSESFILLLSRDFHMYKHLSDKGRAKNEYKCKGQREKSLLIRVAIKLNLN